MRSAARSARGRRASAPSNSSALIMSMMRSAAAMLRAALRERSVQRRRERRFALDERFPGELLPLAPALGRELETFRVEGEGVELAVDVELALECFLEPGGHTEFLRSRKSFVSSGS